MSAVDFILGGFVGCAIALPSGFLVAVLLMANGLKELSRDDDSSEALSEENNQPEAIRAARLIN